MADTETAISLMKTALKLLDAAGEGSAAAMLQHAISIAEGEPVPRMIEEVNERLVTAAARASIERTDSA